MRIPKRIDNLLLAAGLLLLMIYLAARIHGMLLSHFALQAFRKQPTAAAVRVNQSGSAARVDFSLWSQNRIAAYKSLLASQLAKPMAVLSIPGLQLEVPVFDGTDDVTLNRGAGRITGTARPGEPGNVGIAAHRDGFFRGLKDVKVGDRVQLATPDRSLTYVVDTIEIVSPDDIRVLQPGPRPSLTLVTCYPFYFVGDAPRRYIVHASIADSHPSNHESPRE